MRAGSPLACAFTCLLLTGTAAAAPTNLLESNPPTAVAGVRLEEVSVISGGTRFEFTQAFAVSEQGSYHLDAIMRLTSSFSRSSVESFTVRLRKADGEESKIDGDPDARDASGIDLDSVRVSVNGEAVPWRSVHVTDILGKRTRHGIRLPLGKRFALLLDLSRLRAAANELAVEARDLAGNPLASENQKLAYDFPELAGRPVPLQGAASGTPSGVERLGRGE